MTKREIARRCGITPQRVSQLTAAILEKDADYEVRITALQKSENVYFPSALAKIIARAKIGRPKNAK